MHKIQKRGIYPERMGGCYTRSRARLDFTSWGEHLSRQNSSGLGEYFDFFDAYKKGQYRSSLDETHGVKLYIQANPLEPERRR